MKKVEPKPFHAYFLRSDEFSFDLSRFPLYYSQRQAINPLTAILLVLVLNLAVSFAFRGSLVVAISTLVFLGLRFYLNNALSQLIRIRRFATKGVHRENDRIRIELEVQNESPQSLGALILTDENDVSDRTRIHLALTAPLAARSRTRLRYHLLCNGGMGQHQIGPLQGTISDSLGIFDFIYHEDQSTPIFIHPDIQRLPNLEIMGTPSSDRYGPYDVPTAGSNVNFVGIRPFVPGDSLRHIAWKISARQGELHVKEFEKSVNAFVSVFLDLNPAAHFGALAHSTWEYGRDVALSIVANQINLGNSIQFISNDFFLEPGLGPDHLALLSERVALLSPFNQMEGRQNDTGLVQQFGNWIPPGSTVFYITPYEKFQFRSVHVELKELVGRGVHVNCVLIDVTSFAEHFAAHLHNSSVTTTFGYCSIAETDKLLAAEGIRTWVLSHKGKISEAFAHG